MNDLSGDKEKYLKLLQNHMDLFVQRHSIES